MARYVPKNRVIPAHASCRLCGTCWGGYPTQECPASTCLCCGTRQCLGNGLGRGQCSVCFIGLLPGWAGSDRKCGYKGCGQTAVAAVGGQVKYACHTHLARNGKADYVRKRLVERDAAWVVVEDENWRGGHEQAPPAVTVPL